MKQRAQPVRRVWFALCLYILIATPAWSCRQALLFALDVSGSVNGVEYQQQVLGLGSALSDPTVRQLILTDLHQPVTIAVFEWSSQNHQFVVIPWIRLDSAAALDEAIARIESHRKIRAGLKTAMGTALAFGQSMLRAQDHCWQHTIDVSGDGKNNSGPTPFDVYQTGFDRTTVNALVVGNPRNASGEGRGITPADLRDYYEANVIHGPNAFAMVADGYADYARAMTLKIARELQPMVLGAKDGAPDDAG
ncbi:MAG: DUF1194 domain-containing protein [Pseudomonadota bacterium]